ncbi:uncharacterized protein LOC108097056 [Drosophila ficusphila]|uniref:uncharacterized protein LOC108097056 n=1 Tax=Drosophila ficusphila TaxID=30025 RepID=UPI0007E6D278|nr:uncharacterized protein LOC108097056 [Drosophila ficusphila]
MKKEADKMYGNRRSFDDPKSFLTLDEYFNQYVKPSPCVHRRRYVPYSSRSEHFRRMHYFGPAYRKKLSTKTELINQRSEHLSSQIRDICHVLESKILINGAEKRLEQLIKRMPKPSPPSQNKNAQDARAKDAQKPVHPQQDSPDTQPLVVTIGDEVIYDETYKLDPIWMPN